MASSTSSSEPTSADARIPEGPWRRTWLLAAVLVAAHVTWVSTSSWEWFEDPSSLKLKIQSIEQKSLSRIASPSVVVLGTSRAAFSVVPTEFDAIVGLPDRSTVNAGFPGTGIGVFSTLLDRNPRLLETTTVVLFVDEYFFLTVGEPEPEPAPFTVETVETALREQVSARTDFFQRTGWLKHHVLVGCDLKFRTGIHVWTVDEQGLWRDAGLEDNRAMQLPELAASITSAIAKGYYKDGRAEFSEDKVRECERLCRRIIDGGAELVLVQMPTHPRYREFVQTEYAELYRAHREIYAELAEQVGARYYCYEAPADCRLTAEQFADPVHLTVDGAHHFTRFLAEVARDDAWIGHSPNAIATGLKPAPPATRLAGERTPDPVGSSARTALQASTIETSVDGALVRDRAASVSRVAARDDGDTVRPATPVESERAIEPGLR